MVTRVPFEVEPIVEGLGRLVLIMVGLFVLSSVLTGATFFAMAWTGQHVLRTLRVQVFEHLHKLSMSYYTENEAGDLIVEIQLVLPPVQDERSKALLREFGRLNPVDVRAHLFEQ